MRRLTGPLPDDLVEEALARLHRELVARGMLDEERAAMVVQVVREQVKETYGRDQRSQDA